MNFVFFNKGIECEATTIYSDIITSPPYFVQSSRRLEGKLSRDF